MPRRKETGGGFGKNSDHVVIETGMTLPLEKSGLSVLIEFLRIFQMQFFGVEFVYSDGNRLAAV